MKSVVEKLPMAHHICEIGALNGFQGPAPWTFHQAHQYLITVLYILDFECTVP